MAQKKAKKEWTHKVSIVANANTNEVRVTQSPSLKRSTLKDHQILVNVTLAGMKQGMGKLLGGLPILRAATDVEREAKVYVFKDEVQDNTLYKNRKQMYDSIAAQFQDVLGTMFPDIEYIESCTKHQQETIFDMSSEEAEEYKKEIAEITEAVRNPEVKEEPDDDEPS